MTISIGNPFSADEMENSENSDGIKNEGNIRGLV